MRLRREKLQARDDARTVQNSQLDFWKERSSQFRTDYTYLDRAAATLVEQGTKLCRN